MRVTDSMMSASFLRNLGINQANMEKYQSQLSSLETVSKPSDDPLLVSQIMNLDTSIAQNAQYSTTIQDGMDWSSMQDSALSGATDSLNRISTLIQQAANGTLNHEDRQAIKAEVEAEIGALTDALNTSFGGRYVFAGKETTTKPFEIAQDENGEITGLTYNGTTEGDADLTRKIAEGVSVDLLTDGRTLLNEQGTEGEENNLGTFLADVLTALENDDTEALGGTLMEQATDQINNTVNTRAEIGAVYNRLEAAQERNESQSLNLEEMRSEKQDIDLAETYMQYTMEQTAYQASLAVSTKILQTDILDYL